MLGGSSVEEAAQVRPPAVSRLANACVSVSGDRRRDEALVQQVEPDADALVQELRLMVAGVSVPQLERLEVVEEVAARRVHAEGELPAPAR